MSATRSISIRCLSGLLRSLTRKRVCALLAIAAAAPFIYPCTAFSATRSRKRKTGVRKALKKAFSIPRRSRDQYGNPVVVRGANRYEPRTRFPYEMWLKKLKMEFVLVYVGEYMTGKDDDPIPDAERGRMKAYYMGKYEVTNRQYGLFKHDHHSPENGGLSTDADHQPVVNISGQDAISFCAWLHEAHDLEFRLPTQGEWLCATDRKWGNEESGMRLKVANPVGKGSPSTFGLYDLMGNVWEFCTTGPVAGSQLDQADPSQTSGAIQCGAREIERLARDSTCGIGVRFSHKSTGSGFRVLLVVPLSK